MNVDDALVRRAIVAWWALLAVGWLALAVTDATGALAFDLEDLALGLAVVVGGAGVVVLAGTDEQARRLAGALLVVGGTALVVTTVGVTGLPVASGTLSLVADLTILGAMLLVLSNRLGGADDSSV
ncbi:hypothetical protein [Halosimplex pelagicum]|uniref:Uncharacterized protein n=1 Tax=Halosimplex pelagicum TaxID=869886 RepID=A0A7D5TC45_9EURY|nr:hypothetical protein [Halosimplex pelagicum]QLH82629.1 hypothetical protein HZS54_13810 [Halosimplex pelagicum]